jgi:hypothetical protein
MSQAQVSAQPVAQPGVQPNGAQPVEKKSKWWLWLLIVVVIALVGWGIWYWVM